MKGTLYLIPTTLGKTSENNAIPEYTLSILRGLESLVVENIQTSVKFLQWVGDTIPEYKIDFYQLNKNTPDTEIFSFMKPLKAGKDVGLLSEAGAPAVADPGSKLVKMAHQNGIKVVPLVGPSSILLALMATGFNGQAFSFHGYLPIDANKRKQMLIQLEGESRVCAFPWIECYHQISITISDHFFVSDRSSGITIFFPIGMKFY